MVYNMLNPLHNHCLHLCCERCKNKDEPDYLKYGSLIFQVGLFVQIAIINHAPLQQCHILFAFG